MTAIALTIAGSDSGGGAGIQADLKTFSALGVYGASVITALTAQNTIGVHGIHDVPADFVRAQMDAVLTDLKINAIKIGMLGRRDVVSAVAGGLKTWPQRPAVLDPVLVSTSGRTLLADDAIATLITDLIPLATLITPNLPEAARLLGCNEASSRQEVEDQARRLLQFGCEAVLLKGGHSSDSESADLLMTATTLRWFTAPRLPTHNTHGTGCTLSSAITAGLARGLTLENAIAAAKVYVTDAIRAADTLSVGAGRGPVHHFQGIWE